MADDTQLSLGVGGNIIRDEDIGGVHYPVAKIVIGDAGVDDGDVSSTNPLPVSVANASATACVSSSVAQSAVSVPLLPADLGRIGATIYNDVAAGNLLIKFGATASATSFQILLVPGGFTSIINYKGQIDGIWSAAGGGAARIGDLT